MQYESASNENDLAGALRNFLELQSKTPVRTEYCSACGSSMTYLLTRFWLDGRDEHWDVYLPFCMRCNPELRSRLCTMA